MLPVDVGVLGSPISRSTGGFTTALVPKTLCNCEKNLKSSSIPSSSDSTPAPLLLCLSMMSLYFFFKAFSLSRHCFLLHLKPQGLPQFSVIRNRFGMLRLTESGSYRLPKRPITLLFPYCSSVTLCSLPLCQHSLKTKRNAINSRFTSECGFKTTS